MLAHMEPTDCCATTKTTTAMTSSTMPGTYNVQETVVR